MATLIQNPIAGLCAVLFFVFVYWLITTPDRLGYVDDDEGGERFVVTGKAAWYGESYKGARMANGGPFDPDALTAASWDFDLGTRLLVKAGPKSVTVEVTDRGPSEALRLRGRVIDLSSAAFRALAPLDTGVIEVTVEAVR